MESMIDARPPWRFVTRLHAHAMALTAQNAAFSDHYSLARTMHEVKRALFNSPRNLGSTLMWRAFWSDENGVIISAEMILVLSIVVIAVVAGLATLRDAVVTELADVGGAIGSQDQSFVYSGVVSHSAATAGSTFADADDFCDDVDSTDNVNSRCVLIAAPGPIVGGEGTP
jgi:Flp pilus assembly pilin Flp